MIFGLIGEYLAALICSFRTHQWKLFMLLLVMCQPEPLKKGRRGQSQADMVVIGWRVPQTEGGAERSPSSLGSLGSLGWSLATSWMTRVPIQEILLNDASPSDIMFTSGTSGKVLREITLEQFSLFVVPDTGHIPRPRCLHHQLRNFPGRATL